MTGTKCIVGREAASQIAAASLASFLPLVPSHAIRPDQVRRDHARFQPHRGEPPRPVVRAGAISMATRQPGGSCTHQARNLSRRNALRVTTRPCGIDGMNLDDALGQINADANRGGSGCLNTELASISGALRV